MKILHVTASYAPAVRYGGLIVSVHGLCKALAARGHDVHVYSTSVDGPRDSDVPLGAPVLLDGVHVWYFRSPLLRRLYWSPSMGQALDRHMGGFDLAHLHALYVWPVWAAARAARRAGKPYVVAPRGMLEKKLIEKKSRITKSLLLAAVVRRMLERASAIHVTSAREQVEASAFGLALPPVYEVANGVESPASSTTTVSPPVADALAGPPFLLFVGRISWKKGLDRLIDALARLPDTVLVIAGGDDENYVPELKRRAVAAGVSNRCVFCGPVNDGEKAALFARAQALVLPSYSENFGNVVLEAMAAGCPVVVTPEVGLASLVRTSGAGLVVDGAADQLGAGLARVVADAGLRKSMGEQGRAAARDYSWAAVAERMELAYLDILGNTR